MKRIFLLLGFVSALAAAAGQPVHWTAGNLSVTIDKYGYYGSLKVCGQEVLLSKELYPVVSAYDYQVRTPQSVRFSNDTLFCLMNDDNEVLLRIAQLPQCLTMEVISCPIQYRSITFGPVAVNLDEVVGEIVGVVQEGSVAFGMQVLNVKTTGGIPQEAANDYGKKFFYQGHYVDDKPGYSLAATRIDNGTVFQFSGRNRGLHRGQREVRHVGGCHASLTTPVLDQDGQIAGTKVAMFGCPRSKVLNHIGLLETALGLPHPTTIDGTWVKASSSKNSPKKESKKKNMEWVVKNVIEWNDVTVIKDFVPHLQQQLLFQLEDNLNATDTTIHLLTGAYNCFPLPMEGYQVVRIEDELIRYRSAEDNDGHVTLSGCFRGAFGTVAAAHKKYIMGGRLWTVKEGFIPDLELLDTLADRAVEGLAKHSVATLPTQITFEHLGYCALTGQDEYAVARFVNRCSEKWSRPVVCQADCLTNYTWHILSNVTKRGSIFSPEMSDTTWQFLREVPVHDHTHGEDHGHEHHGHGHHEHEHHHDMPQGQSQEKALPDMVREMTTMEDFLKRNLLF